MFTTLIEPVELLANLGHTDWLIVDCRYNLFAPTAGRESWQEHCIPGAQYLHLDDDLSGSIIPGQTGRHPLPEKAVFALLMESLGLSRKSQLVVYDDKGGGIAARLWWMARWIGHEKVAVLNGGWPAWLAEGGRTEKGVDVQRTQTKVRAINQERVEVKSYDYPAVNALRVAAEYSLVDSRTSPRYLGDEEPIDPIAGHIPGAINLPWPGNLTAEGRFKSKAELKNRFAQLEHEAANTVFYCGSGVTACHNILAYYHAYGELPGLYPGSWSDWIVKHGL